MPNAKRISFRDPDGFVFSCGDKIYRAVLPTYYRDLKLFKDLGILAFPQLVKHTEIDINSLPNDTISWIYEQISDDRQVIIFELNKIEFISYPWEWTPSMLQDAAYFTLEFQNQLLEKGLTLKDASFYNVQFINGRPIFIDLLSIKIAGPNIYPWFAYGQFLQHFVFPLIILKYKNFDSLQFLQAYPDGITKAEVLRHVPIKSHFSIFELFHIHLFKRLDNDEGNNSNQAIIPIDKQKAQLRQLISFAQNYIKKMFKKHAHSSVHWANYN